MSDVLNGFIGTRKLDPSTLKYEHGRPGRRALYTIARTADGLEFTLDADDADGKPMYVVYGGKLDGVDRAHPGSPVTVAMSLLEDGSIESVARKNGVVVDRWTRTVLADGETMLICRHGHDTTGKPFRNAGFYRRTGTGAGS